MKSRKAYETVQHKIRDYVFEKIKIHSLKYGADIPQENIRISHSTIKQL